MAVSKHSPGPWTWESTHVDQYRVTLGRVLDADRQQVTEPMYLSQANARLITGAPELLELLRAYAHAPGAKCPLVFCARNVTCVCFRAKVLIALLDSED